MIEVCRASEMADSQEDSDGQLQERLLTPRRAPLAHGARPCIATYCYCMPAFSFDLLAKHRAYQVLTGNLHEEEHEGYT